MELIIAVIKDSEILGVKEFKLNVCKLCSIHASKSSINPYLLERNTESIIISYIMSL